MSVFDFFYPEDREMLERDFYPRVRRDGHASVEIRFRHQRTGDPLWMKYNVVLLRDLHGEPSGYGTISQDLTAQRQKEDQLRESNRRKDESIAVLREVADSIPQIFWSAGADGKRGLLQPPLVRAVAVQRPAATRRKRARCCTPTTARRRSSSGWSRSAPVRRSRWNTA